MLYLYMMMLVGYREPDMLSDYHTAILAATEDAEERLLLATVGKHENYYHRHSPTPVFGLVWETNRRMMWAYRHHKAFTPITVDEGARLALRDLHALRRTCFRLVPNRELNVHDRWGMALGRYHHGTQGPNHGCWIDRLANTQTSDMVRRIPNELPPHARLYVTPASAH